MEEGISMRSIWRSCPVRRSLLKEGEDQNPPSKKRKKDDTEESEDEETSEEEQFLATSRSNIQNIETSDEEEVNCC